MFLVSHFGDPHIFPALEYFLTTVLMTSVTRFRCNTDCKNDPENCIGERLFRAMGDMLVLGGFQVN